MNPESTKAKSHQSFLPHFLRDSDALGALGQLKRAVKHDIPDIKKMITENCTKIFGDFSLTNIIECSFLPLCQFDVNGKLIGFIALDTFPNDPMAVQNDWIHWIHRKFALTEVSARNALFVHMICWDNKYSRIFLRHILESVFFSDSFLQYIIFVMPSNAPLTIHKNVTSLVNLLTRVNPCGFIRCETLPFLNIAYRSRFCPKLNVRKAVEEDNDDLVALIHGKSTLFKTLYGEFYISEIIRDQNTPERVVLMAEFSNISVGVMILNTKINYEKLNESFELEAFGYLLKKNENLEVIGEGDLKIDIVSKTNAVKDETVISECTMKTDKSDSDKSANELNSSNDKLKESTDDELDTDLPILSVSKASKNVFKKSVNFFDRKISIADQSDTMIGVNVNRDDGNSELLQSFDSSFSISEEEIDSGTESCFDNSLNIDPFAYDIKTSIETQIEKENSDMFTERNAFMIEVFAMDEDMDERFGFDLLEAAFVVFPELEYCLLSVPSHIKPFPLLEHFVFISPKSTDYFDHCLYVVHRNCIKSNLVVRRAYFSDIYQIQALVKNLPNGMSMVTKVKDKLRPGSVHHYIYVILTDGVVIGFTLLRESDYKMNNLLKHYRMYPASPFLESISPSSCILEEMILVPQFEQSSRFFLREILRISEFSDIYWPLYSLKNLKSDEINCISTLSHFVPLLRRSVMEENPELQRKYKLPTKEHIDSIPLAVFSVNHAVCSCPRIDINTRLVIVGASDTAFSFLKALLLGPSSVYLTFTSVTIVSKHGISLPLNKDTHVEKMLTSCGINKFGLSEKQVLQTCISVIKGTMKTINRRDKYIVIDDGDRLHFDLLFLFCGKQYQDPNYHQEIGAPALRMYGSDCIPIDVLSYSPSLEYLAAPSKPHNLFLVNDIVDACESFSKLTKFFKGSSSSNVIVYGATIETYCCVNALLEFGILGSHIIFVEPFPSLDTKEHQFTVFNNKYVDMAVSQCMSDNDIQIYNRHYFDSWILDEDGQGTKITSVKFSSYYRTVVIECAAMFYYGMKDIDKDTFMAINKCGLVYNGGLVINGYCGTSDNCIYAAGPMTEYSKKNKTRDHNHSDLLSEEVGYKFGESILNNLNPFASEKETSGDFRRSNSEETISFLKNSFSNISLFLFDHQKSDETGLIHQKCSSMNGLIQSQMPLFTNCTLPSGLKYLNIVAPGKVEPMELKALRHNYGKVMETFENGYFQLHLDNEGYVTSITCLTPNTLDVHNISCLWKKHELILNKLVHRFECGQINDFYEYFRQSWAYAIYHDKFDDLMEKINEQCISKNYFRRQFDDDESQDRESDSFRKYVEEKIVEFININNDMLPMYSCSNVKDRKVSFE